MAAREYASTSRFRRRPSRPAARRALRAAARSSALRVWPRGGCGATRAAPRIGSDSLEAAHRDPARPAGGPRRVLAAELEPARGLAGGESLERPAHGEEIAHLVDPVVQDEDTVARDGRHEALGLEPSHRVPDRACDARRGPARPEVAARGRADSRAERLGQGRGVRFQSSTFSFEPSGRVGEAWLRMWSRSDLYTRSPRLSWTSVATDGVVIGGGSRRRKSTDIVGLHGRQGLILSFHR